MNFRAILLAAAAVVGVGGAGQAAEPFTWTGFYVGANVGYVWGEVEEPDLATVKIDPEGFFAGGQAGYDYQFDNNIVLGAFVTAPAVFAEEKDALFGTTIESDVNWAMAGGVRAGYAFGNFLPYVMGGYIVGEGSATLTLGGGASFDDTQTHDGYLVGVGADYRISEMFDIGIAYTHTGMSTEEYDLTPAVAAPLDVGYDADAVTFKVDFRF
jgi:outer membrane immunogenic protein